MQEQSWQMLRAALKGEHAGRTALAAASWTHFALRQFIACTTSCGVGAGQLSQKTCSELTHKLKACLAQIGRRATVTAWRALCCATPLRAAPAPAWGLTCLRPSTTVFPRSLCRPTGDHLLQMQQPAGCRQRAFLMLAAEGLPQEGEHMWCLMASPLMPGGVSVHIHALRQLGIYRHNHCRNGNHVG